MKSRAGLMPVNFDNLLFMPESSRPDLADYAWNHAFPFFFFVKVAATAGLGARNEGRCFPREFIFFSFG